MMRFVRAVAIGWLVAGSSCAGEQEPVIVLYSVFPEDECAFDPESNDHITSGRYDVSGRTGYLLGPILQNNLLARTTSGSNTGVEDGELRLETNVDISVHLPADVVDRLPADVSRSFTIYVATDSIGPGQRYAAPLELLSPELVEALPGAVLPGMSEQATVDIVFHVTRTGNTKGDVGVIDAREYTFPLTLCNGCLVVTCDCEDDGVSCIPGTEIHATTCGRTQDPQDDRTFSCLAEATGSSSGPADDGMESSGSGGSSG